MRESPTIAASPRLYALIPCAGSGSRAATAGPKQYQRLAGRPMVEHTLAAFSQVTRLASGMLVLAPGDPWRPKGEAFFVADCGGAKRGATVLNGLRALQQRGAQDSDWVLVHDAARCLITPELIDRLIDACLDDDVGGLLAQPLADTLKRGSGTTTDTDIEAEVDAVQRVAATVPREGHWLAQTPQMFRIGLLVRALEQAGDGVTDEASAVEALGLRPRLVPGSPQNFKLTWPEDFAVAEALLMQRGHQRSHQRSRP